LRLYNLKNGSKIDDYLFPEAPIYTRFFDGRNRLLVLTAQQFAYILDVATPSSSADDHASESSDRMVATH